MVVISVFFIVLAVLLALTELFIMRKISPTLNMPDDKQMVNSFIKLPCRLAIAICLTVASITWYFI